MPTLTTQQRNLLASGRIMHRFFAWFDTHDLSGNPEPFGAWNDVGDVTINVDGVDRVYQGSGTLVAVGDLTARGDLTVPTLAITLDGTDARIINLVRGTRIAQAPVDVRLGLFDPDTHALVPPLVRWFAGFVDEIEMRTKVGSEGAIVLSCQSIMRELTIASTETRSQASQEERAPGDNFFQYASVQAIKPIYFGRRAPRSQGKWLWP